MRKLSTLEVSAFAQNIISFSNYKNVFGIGDFGENGVRIEDYENLSSPMRLNVVLIILITEGNARVSLDNVPYKLSANNLIVIMPSHITQITYSDPDVKGKLLLVSIPFLEECKPNIDSSLINYIRLRKSPLFSLEPDETVFLDNYAQLLRDKVTDKTHHFQDEIIHLSFITFLVELVNIGMRKKSYIQMPKLTSKEEIVNKFLQHLLLHFREEHTIAFYADKLCITPQYLSSVLKALTDKTGSEWIDEMILAEAKVLLKSPKTSVQEVSNILNFADQSTFGKFFRKHTGVSPTQFRRM